MHETALKNQQPSIVAGSSKRSKLAGSNSRHQSAARNLRPLETGVIEFPTIKRLHLLSISSEVHTLKLERPPTTTVATQQQIWKGSCLRESQEDRSHRPNRVPLLLMTAVTRIVHLATQGVGATSMWAPTSKCAAPMVLNRRMPIFSRINSGIVVPSTPGRIGRAALGFVRP